MKPQLDKIRAVAAEVKGRLEKATPGEWRPFDAGPLGGEGAGVAIGDDVQMWPLFDKNTSPQGVANAFLCAHAPTDLARLNAIIEKLIRVVEKMDEALAEISEELSEHPLAMHAPSNGANIATTAQTEARAILEGK